MIRPKISRLDCYGNGNISLERRVATFMLMRRAIYAHTRTRHDDEMSIEIQN